MASVCVEAAMAGAIGRSSTLCLGHAGRSVIDQLSKELHAMKIWDDKEDDHGKDKELEPTAVNSNGIETDRTIVANMVGSDGHLKQAINYMVELVVGTGSFGVV